MTRERLVGLLWGEHDEGRARRHLSDTLYIAHHDLGGDTITTSGATVHLNPARISTDVATFRAAVGRSDPATAVAAYGGPLLEGFYLSGAPAFEEWLAIERRRHEEEYAAALEALARVCEIDGDHVAAVRWWHRLGTLDPLNSRVAIGTARALVASGDRGNALEHLRTHCDRLHEELGIEQPPEITAALEEVRSADACIPAPVAVTAPETPEPVARDRAPAEWTPPPSTPRTPRGTARRRARWAAAAILVPVVVAIAIDRVSGAPPEPISLDPDLVAVIPFRVASPDEKIRDLTTYVPDLFWEALSGEFGPRIAEPVPVVRRWRAAGGATDAPLTDGEARAVARAGGAGRVMIGSVSGTLGQLTLTATIQDTRRGLTLAPPTAVEGPYDSVRSLVGRLATLLLAKDAGAPRHQYRDLASHPVRAVQAYLTGLRAARTSSWNRQFFDLALQLDSTLLIAELAAYQAGEFDQDLARVLWRDQGRLSAPDRSFVRPLVGWRFGASRSLVERIAQFDSAAHRAPAWESTNAWAVALGAWGHLTDAGLWLPRARAAQERLAAKCPNHLTTWSHMFALAMFAEDSAAARRYSGEYLEREAAADGAPPSFAWSLELRLALMEGDSATAARLWDRGASVMVHPEIAGAPSLYGIHLGPVIGGLLVDGRGLTDLDRFVEQARARNPVPSFPILNWARARGRSHDHDLLRDMVYAALPPVTAAGLRVRDALYLGAPADSTVRAAAAFLDLVAQGAIVPPPDSADPTPGTVGPARARCWSTLWRVTHGNTGEARSAVAELRERVALPYRYAVCASLIEVALAQRGDGSLHDVLPRLDSLDRAVPLEIWPYHRGARDLTFGVSGLVLARLLTEIGDTAGALAAARRGPRGPVGTDPDPHIWLGMLPDFLREEARLAAAAGDAAGAVRAFRHYLTLRDGATGRWAAELQRVQQEYAELMAERTR